MSEHGGQEGGYDFGLSPEPMTSPEMGMPGMSPEAETMAEEPMAESSMMAEDSQLAQEMQQDEQLLERLEQEGIGGTHESAPSPSAEGYAAPAQSATYQQPAQPPSQQADQAEVQNAQASAAAERAEAQAVQSEESANQYAEQTYQQEDNAFDQTLEE